jgi:hypothetical protein
LALLEAMASLAPDLLLPIARDTAAKAIDRRKAASQIAEFFLPKHTGRKKPRRGKFPPDEFGFAVDPEVVRELRDSKMELSCNRKESVRPTRLPKRREKPSRTHRGDLHRKKRVAETGGPPITAAQEARLRFLTLLHPSPPRPSPSQEMIEAHPFSTDWPSPYIVGNRTTLSPKANQIQERIALHGIRHPSQTS